MASLRDKIQAAKDIKEEVVDVPEWDVQILVRGLNGEQRADLQAPLAGKRGAPPAGKDIANFEANLLILACYDPETKEPVFEKGDRDWLKAKSGPALDRLSNVATRLSGLEKQAVAEAAKNSGATQN